jgi:hypothetical protein
MPDGREVQKRRGRTENQEGVALDSGHPIECDRRSDDDRHGVEPRNLPRDVGLRKGTARREVKE